MKISVVFLLSLVKKKRTFKTETNSVYSLSISFLVPEIWRFKVVS